jgi:hypothetical protein
MFMFSCAAAQPNQTARSHTYCRFAAAQSNVSQLITSSESGAALKDFAVCAGSAAAYSVVRCHGRRPVDLMSVSMRSGDSSCPWAAPAQSVRQATMSANPVATHTS